MNHYEQATQEVRDAFKALCKGRVEAAVKAEREACAKVCETLWDLRDDEKARMYANKCAKAIRARGQE